jgi:hypothetical protein
MQRWQEWLKDLERKGLLVNFGIPLVMDEGKVVRTGKGSFTDGPYAETKDVVAGFSVVKARDLEEAIALTKDHPLFEMGGMIEVRTIRTV